MRTIRLSQKQRELIEKVGVYIEKNGSPPASARIAALLLVSDETELTFEEIHETLQISKSAASNGLNALLAGDKIEYITKPGDRKRYFRSRLGQFTHDFEKRFQHLLTISQLMREVLELRTEATKEFNENIRKAIDFMEFLQAELPLLHKKWEERNK